MWLKLNKTVITQWLYWTVNVAFILFEIGNKRLLPCWFYFKRLRQDWHIQNLSCLLDLIYWKNPGISLSLFFEVGEMCVPGRGALTSSSVGGAGRATGGRFLTSVCWKVGIALRLKAMVKIKLILTSKLVRNCNQIIGLSRVPVALLSVGCDFLCMWLLAA